MKKLFLIYQKVSNGYDTYDSAVVVAESEEEARKIHPSGYKWDDWTGYSWCNPEDVKVEFIGNARKDLENKTVVCASFNAG